MLGCFHIHAGFEVVARARVQVKLQLFLEFLVHLVVAEQIRESVKPAHRNPPC
jgi:hypothetical protein